MDERPETALRNYVDNLPAEIEVGHDFRQREGDAAIP